MGDPGRHAAEQERTDYIAPEKDPADRPATAGRFAGEALTALA